MMRRYIIAGNWKMNKTARETKAFFDALATRLPEHPKSEILICPPFTSLSVAHAQADERVALGAQNVHPQASGAFTGEISLPMLSEFVSYVIVGHSERRTLFVESDALINEKMKVVLSGGLKPIMCVGESLAERKSGKAFEVIQRELENGLKGISSDAMKQVTIAYEPIWAIGTGETATPAIAQEVHEFMRTWLKNHLGTATADHVRLLYGGSLKLSNAKELLSQPDIDGGLIGGASLDANSFADIVKVADDLS